MKKLLLLLIVSCACQKPDRDPQLTPANALPPQAEFTTNQENKYQKTLTEDDRDRLERHYPFTLKRIDKQKSLNAQDIKNLVRSGVSDEVILDLIVATRSSFYLTPKDEQELEQAGVSNQVIEAMRSTTNAIGQACIK